MQYTKERIEMAIKEYERLYVEYLNSGFTYKVKIYLENMPLVSKKLKGMYEYFLSFIYLYI